MEEEVKVVDGEYAATISNLVKLEKKQKRLERLWDDGILSGEEVSKCITMLHIHSNLFSWNPRFK